MVPAFLLVRGWTADEVKRGLKFLYQEEQDGDGNIRFVPASRGRNIPPKWWTKHHDPADTRRSWDAFVTDQLVLQVVAVNLFSAPQATFLKRIARPLHGMSSGPQLHSDTCQLVVAMIMALARQAAEGDGNLQFTAKQYIDTAEALGFSFKDTPVEIPHFDQLSFNNFELVQWPEVADLVGSVLDGVPTPGDPIRSFGRYFLRYQPENLGSMMTYPKDCKCDVRTARHARSIAALVLGGILNPYSREALVAMCRTYADYGNQEEIFDEELLYELERWGLDFTDGDLANFFKNPTIENYLHLVLPGGPWSSVQLPLTVRETSRLFRKSADPAVQGGERVNSQSTTSARNVGLPSSLTVDSASTSRKDIGNMPEVAESFTERAARCAPSNFGQQPAWLHTSTVQPSARECMMVQTLIPRLSLERMPRRGNQVQSSWGPSHSGLLLGRKRVLRSGTLAGHFGRRMLSISFCRSFLWPMRRSSPISPVTSAGEFDARDSPKHVRQKPQNPKPPNPKPLNPIP